MPLMLAADVEADRHRRIDADDAHAQAARERVRRRSTRSPRGWTTAGRYLCGDEFTAADLAFAALAAAVLVPARYGIPLPPARRAARAATPARCGRCASTPAGRFALRLYDQERP